MNQSTTTAATHTSEPWHVKVFCCRAPNCMCADPLSSAHNQCLQAGCIEVHMHFDHHLYRYDFQLAQTCRYSWSVWCRNLARAHHRRCLNKARFPHFSRCKRSNSGTHCTRTAGFSAYCNIEKSTAACFGHCASNSQVSMKPPDPLPRNEGTMLLLRYCVVDQHAKVLTIFVCGLSQRPWRPDIETGLSRLAYRMYSQCICVRQFPSQDMLTAELLPIKQWIGAMHCRESCS